MDENPAGKANGECLARLGKVSLEGNREIKDLKEAGEVTREKDILPRGTASTDAQSRRAERLSGQSSAEGEGDGEVLRNNSERPGDVGSGRSWTLGTGVHLSHRTQKRCD